MQLWNPTVQATKSLSNVYWKLLLTWLFKMNTTKTTTTRHTRDNEEVLDRAQKLSGYN